MRPIALMSFNRPHYLEAVLQSLVQQRDVVLEQQQIYFFQDGGINALSGKKYAEEDTIEHCIKLVRQYLPQANILRSKNNIGVALNFERAEKIMFEELNAEIAYFFEDDMLLGPYYLKCLSRLDDLVVENPRVGYFAAYGTQHATLLEQQKKNDRVIPMTHNWAFGLTKIQWLASKQYVDEYLDLVRNNDYRDRDEKQIARLMKSWGFKCPGSSQDVAKSLACYKSGGTKLRTYTAYAKYIGEFGLHSDAEEFDRMGFRNAVYVEDDIYAVTEISESDITHARKVLLDYAMEECISPD